MTVLWTFPARKKQHELLCSLECINRQLFTLRGWHATVLFCDRTPDNQTPPCLGKHVSPLVLRLISPRSSDCRPIGLWEFFMSLDSIQADDPPDVKWSPLPIHVCNTRGLANALPSHRQILNVSYACNYTDTHTLQTGTQQRCFAAKIGMVVVLPRTSSFTKSSTTT